MPKMTAAADKGLRIKKNTLETGAWVELFQIKIDKQVTLYLTNHPTSVVYQGKEYQPYPIRHEAIREEANGKMQKLTVHVANVLREVQYYLEQYDGLRGKQVTLIQINADEPQLGDVRQTFLIESASSNARLASFVLGKPIPTMEIRLPLRVVTEDLFPGLVRP